MADNAATELKLANVPPPEDPPAVAQPATDQPEAELQAGSEHPGGAHGTKPGLPQLDTTTFASQLFWLLISFVVLYLVISRIAVPKIGGVIADRAGRIKGDLDKAAQATRDSEAAIAAYEKALAEARARAIKFGDEIRRTMQNEAEQKMAAISKQLAVKTATAEAQIAAMRGSAMARIGDVARDTAAEIVVKLTGETANASDLNAAVSNALKTP